MPKLNYIKNARNILKIFSDEKKSERYRKQYSDETFFRKLKRYAKIVGAKVVYPAMLLHYLLKSDEVPLRIKLILTAALGYFILPIDFIPDFAPLIGFSDDLGVLLLVLKQLASYVTPEIKKQAREQLNKWFGIYDLKIIDEIDNKYFEKKSQ